MRMVAYGFTGLLLGALGGFWLGLMLALIYVDATPVSCSDGICSYLALEIGLFGGAIGGLSGTVYGVQRAVQRPTGAAAAVS